MISFDAIGALLVGIITIALTIYWMVVAWRGMRALERLAEAGYSLSTRRGSETSREPHL